MYIYFCHKFSAFLILLIVCPSLGLFAGEIFEENEFICMYGGEIMCDNDSFKVGVVQDTVEETYLFTLNSDFAVDASKVGNIMRYSNHANDIQSNSLAKVISFVDGVQIICLFANKRIDIGQEILFNYNISKNFKWIQNYNNKYNIPN